MHILEPVCLAFALTWGAGEKLRQGQKQSDPELVRRGPRLGQDGECPVAFIRDVITNKTLLIFITKFS